MCCTLLFAHSYHGCAGLRCVLFGFHYLLDCVHDVVVCLGVAVLCLFEYGSWTVLIVCIVSGCCMRRGCVWSGIGHVLCCMRFFAMLCICAFVF